MRSIKVLKSEAPDREYIPVFHRQTEAAFDKWYAESCPASAD
jgi:hypothetical protein